MRALIAGGTGTVGKHVAACAKSMAGWDVTVLSRTPKAPGAIAWGDLDAHRGHFDCVINLCGSQFLDPMIRWNSATRDEIRSSRIGTAEVLAAFVESDPDIKRFVQVSGVGAYPYSDTARYTEETPVQRIDDDFFQSLVVDWEAAAATDRTTVIRSGVVLSQHGGAFKEQLTVFKLGLGAVMGSGSQYFPWIHADDLARLILHTSIAPTNLGLVNGVAPAVTTQEEFCRQFKRSLGRPLWFPPVATPEFVVRAMFGGPDRADFLLKGMIVEPKVALSSGFDYKFSSIDAALDNLVSE